VELAVHGSGDEVEGDRGCEDDEGGETEERAGLESGVVEPGEPEIDEVREGGGHQEAGGDETFETFGGCGVGEFKTGAVNEDFGDGEEEIRDDGPGEGEFGFGPFDKKSGDGHDAGGDDLEEEACEHLVAGGEEAGVGVDLLKEPAEEWGEDHDGPGIDGLQLIGGEAEGMAAPGEAGREVDVLFDEEDPEGVVVFVGDPEEDDKEEDAEEFAEDASAFAFFMGSEFRTTDGLDGVMFFSECEDTEGDDHEPGGELKGGGVAVLVAERGEECR